MLACLHHTTLLPDIIPCTDFAELYEGMVSLSQEAALLSPGSRFESVPYVQS